MIADPYNRVLQGDVLDVLPELEDDIADVVVTSPPYWALRDYDGAETEWPDGWTGQLGQEPDPDLYVRHLLDVFEELKRVVKPSGCVFVNLDDKYTTGTTGSQPDGVDARPSRDAALEGDAPRDYIAPYKSRNAIPERFVVGMLDQGWVYRNDIVWEKTNAMPEKVTDRPARRWEHIYFFTQDGRETWANLDAVREPPADSTLERLSRDSYDRKQYDDQTISQDGTDSWVHENGKTPGDVIRTPTASYADAHSAVFPEDVPEFAIRLACPETVCPECGTPYDPVKEAADPWNIDATGRPQAERAVEIAEEEGLTDEHLRAVRAVGLNFEGDKLRDFKDGAGRDRDDVEELAEEARDALGSYTREFQATKEVTVGFEPGCACLPADSDSDSDSDSDTDAPAGVVLDPFGGSGTAGKVANDLDRRYIVIEISEDYAEQARDRISGRYERTKPARRRARQAKRKADRAGHEQATLTGIDGAEAPPEDDR